MDKLKSIFNKAKNFINTHGFTAIIAAVIGITLWILGHKILAGISFGVFFTRNWDILKGLIRKK